MPPDSSATDTTTTQTVPDDAAAISDSAPPGAAPQFARVLTNLHHGGHVVPDEAPGRSLRSAEVSALSEVVAGTTAPPATTPFGYLFRDLEAGYPAAHLPVEPASTVVAALKALGSAMVDAPAPADPTSTVPPVYTYWGQFVDHDITANTDRPNVIDITDDPLTPIEPDFVLGLLRNLREPALNLDSVYGTGPGDPVVPYTGITLDTGPLQVLEGAPFAHVPGDDLPREDATGKARIGDSRNDENLIVAQLHLAFLKFHNEVVEWLGTNEPGITYDDQRFERARELTRWHYQRITVEDFLRRIALGSVVDEVLADSGRNPVLGADDKPFMPLEHSVAAYRFGHSMVRSRYDHNENFGRPEGGDDPDPNRPRRATFEQLFQFTGNNVIKGAAADPDAFEFTTLPDNWPIRWKRFTEGDKADRLARKIDTHLAPPLKDLLNEGNRDEAGNPVPPRESRILKRLAVRNLLRGYRLAIPTGQAVAQAIGATPLTPEQLLQGDPGVKDALLDGGLLDATPLWFYVLKEAELSGGERLGEVGSHIVCTTIIGQIKADPDSYLNNGPWTFADGVKFPDGREVTTIRDFLEFAGVLI